jgi:hypothetical protein
MLIFGFLQEHVRNLVCNHMNDKMEVGEKSAKQKKDRIGKERARGIL